MSRMEGCKIVINGFRKAGICEAFQQAIKLKDLVENPFLDIEIKRLQVAIQK